MRLCGLVRPAELVRNEQRTPEKEGEGYVLDFGVGWDEVALRHCGCCNPLWRY